MCHLIASVEDYVKDYYTRWTLTLDLRTINAKYKNKVCFRFKTG
jgi:hypothetical protein